MQRINMHFHLHLSYKYALTFITLKLITHSSPPVLVIIQGFLLISHGHEQQLTMPGYVGVCIILIYHPHNRGQEFVGLDSQYHIYLTLMSFLTAKAAQFMRTILQKLRLMKW